MSKKKLTYEYVSNYFKDRNCELLETEYKNNETKMKYKCECGNIAYIKWAHFLRGQRCGCGSKKTAEKLRFSYEYVQNYFKSKECELLETKYINTSTKMKYKCSCGNISFVTFTNFKTSDKCMECNGSKKLTYEYVFNYFKEHDCELLETEYINSSTLMNYRCECGNESKTIWNNFRKEHRCNKCGNKKRSKKLRYSYEYVFAYFKENDCSLLSKEYINNNQRLDYICSCGNKAKIKFIHFKRNQRCPECRNKKISESKYLTYEFVFDFFKNQNCELLESYYINNETKMKYKCSCGDISYICFGNFQAGKRCGCEKSKGEVKIIKILKENNINFKPQKRFDDCRDKKPLPFDFYIIDKNILIEFDGHQHYTPWGFGKVSKDIEAAEKSLKQQKIRDEIKTKYCRDNSIKLIRIPFWHIDNIEKIFKKEDII